MREAWRGGWSEEGEGGEGGEEGGGSAAAEAAKVRGGSSRQTHSSEYRGVSRRHGSMVKVPALAAWCPGGSCSSSGRAWWLWAARCSQGGRSRDSSHGLSCSS